MLLRGKSGIICVSYKKFCYATLNVSYYVLQSGDNMCNLIKKAIIPVAGLGTRLLPITKSIPKCMIPIVDKPVIHYLVEEAVQAGCTDVLLIINESQDSIIDYFATNQQLNHRLNVTNKPDMLKECNKFVDLVNIHFVHQDQPLGLGHAILLARQFTGNDPFLVLYGDDIIDAQIPVCSQLISAYRRYGKPCVGTCYFSDEAIQRASSLKMTHIEDNYYLVSDMIEKPLPGSQFSNYPVVGRVLLTSDIYMFLQTNNPGSNGEYQLTDAMAEYSRTKGGLIAVEFSGCHYDMGNKFHVIRAQIEFGLKHPETKMDMKNYLQNISSNQKI